MSTINDQKKIIDSCCRHFKSPPIVDHVGTDGNINSLLMHQQEVECALAIRTHIPRARPQKQTFEMIHCIIRVREQLKQSNRSSDTTWNVTRFPPRGMRMASTTLSYKSSQRSNQNTYPADELWPSNPRREHPYCAATTLDYELVSPPIAIKDWTGGPPNLVCLR